MPAPVTIPAQAARRLLLDTQGLLAGPDRPASPARVQQLVERLGFVQVDSINVVERAHHLTLGARLSRYRPEQLTRLLERDRTLFEHWTHDSSAIPVRWYAHWKPRFAGEGARIRANAWWRERMGPNPDAVLAQVRARIEKDGPLRSSDFDHRRDETGGWWSWKPQKAALEYLWRTGELAVVGRVRFQKVYDLARRVFPALHAAPAPEPSAHLDWACRTALERLGVATPREIAAFWAAIDAPAASAWCEAECRLGRIVRVRVASADGSAPRAAFAPSDWERRLDGLPRTPECARLLSPFDPVLRDRKRALRLFGFDYRFEAFVPQAQRKHGYYVMPLLAKDALVGRVDPRFDRRRNALVIARAWFEKSAPLDQRRAWLEEAAHRLGSWLGADRVVLPRPSRRRPQP